MLKALRKNTKVIIWTVVIAFILWGGYSFGSGLKKEGRVAGEVFGKDVSFQEFNRFYSAAQVFTFNNHPISDPEELKAHAWQSVIYSREAKKRNLQVSDGEVRGEILRLLKLQGVDDPSPDMYRAWLRANFRTSPQEFESQVREILRVQKLLRDIAAKHPIQQPSVEEAHKRFQLDENMLNADMKIFDKREDADAFRKKIQNAADWDKEKAADSSIRPSGLVALDAWIHLWEIPEQEAFKLLALPKDSITGVLPTGPRFAVLRILETKTAAEDKFEKEFKDKYLEAMRQARQQAAFLEAGRDINERAALKDFLPHSPAAEEPAPAKAAPAPAPAAR